MAHLELADSRTCVNFSNETPAGGMAAANMGPSGSRGSKRPKEEKDDLDRLLSEEDDDDDDEQDGKSST